MRGDDLSRGLGRLSLLFALSGVPALVHEVVWQRLFTLVLGHGFFAVSAIVSSFMLGLGLGALLGGKLADATRRPLRFYVLAELSIACYAAALPLLSSGVVLVFKGIYPALGQDFVLFNLIQFAIVLVVLLPPTLAMGATLPLIMRAAARSSDEIATTGAWLYGVNALGAASGIVIAGFVLLPLAGLWASLYTAVVLNLILAGLGLWMERSQAPAPAPGGPDPSLAPERSQRPGGSGKPSGPPGATRIRRSVALWLLVSFAVAGLANLGYQVYWTRILARVYGPTPLAFPLILFPFVLFVGVGGLAGSCLVSRFPAGLAFGWLQVLTAASMGLASALLLGAVPAWLAEALAEPGVGFWGIVGRQAAWTCGLLFVPATLMGISFAFCVAMWGGSLARAGRAVGLVYSSITVGNVAGAFVAGYLLLPALGVHGTLALLVSLQLLCGLSHLLARWRTMRRPAAHLAVAAGVAAACLALPRPSLVLVESAPYLYGPRNVASAREQRQELAEFLSSSNTTLYYREDLLGSVSVTRSAGGELAVRVNGKATSGQGDLPTLRLLAHLPLAARTPARRVLIVGLGTGTTLRSATLHSVGAIDCVEISPRIIEAARTPEVVRVFHKGAIDDPRVQLIVQDGRTHVEMTDRSYDVIVSEPPNLWIEGVASLFTREFYAHARRVLAPGGIFAQWVHAYRVSRRVFASALATFADSFAHVALWELIPGADYVVLGSDRPIRLGLQALLSNPAIRDELREVGIDEPAAVLAGHMGDARAIQEWAAGAALHTDSGNFIAYRASIDLFSGSEDPFAGRPFRRASPIDLAGDSVATGRSRVRFERLRRARVAYLEALRLFRAREQLEGEARLMAARGLDPRLPCVRQVLHDQGSYHLLAGERLRRQGDLPAAVAAYSRAGLLAPDLWPAFFKAGNLLMAQGRWNEALEAFERALLARPGDPRIMNNLAGALARLGRHRDSVKMLEKILIKKPNHEEALENLARLYKRLGDPERYRRILDRLRVVRSRPPAQR